MSMAISLRETRYLICSHCKEYLSCGPVMLVKRNNVCGRCYNAKDKGLRNYAYEKAAKHLRFPCKYHYLGCEKMFIFSENYIYSHEYSCEFRAYKCFFWNSGEPHCQWENLSSKMLGHCQTNHPDKILNNSCFINIDVNRRYDRTYLLVAFAEIFTVNIVVNPEENTVHFHTHFIGKQRGASEFQYILNMRKQRVLITRTGNCKNLTAPMKISDLKDLFQEMNGATFHLTIFTYCGTCCNELTFGKLTLKGNHWQCPNCTLCIKECEYSKRDCTFKDHPCKVSKHEEYFCTYSTGLDDVIVIPHGKIWVIKKNDDKCAFRTDVGLVLCEFTATRTDRFEFFFYSPLKSSQDGEFSCQVNVFSSNAVLPTIFNPPFQKDNYFDWYLGISKNDYPVGANELAIELVIKRTGEIYSCDEYFYFT